MKKVFLPAVAIFATISWAYIAYACDAHAETNSNIEVSATADAELGNKQSVFTPESVLPAGTDYTISVNPYTGEAGEARKGTVAATLNNVALLNKLLPSSKTIEEKKQIEDLVAAIDSLISSLRVVGIFDMFTVNEWLSSPNQSGRTMAAVLYLKKYPKEITPEVKRTLVRIEKSTKIKLLKDNIQELLKN